MKKHELVIPTAEEERLINAGIAADSDAYELTDKEFERMKPVVDVHPTIPPRVRGPQKTLVKDRITIRLNHDVVGYFKGHGKGWQTKINDILQKYVDSHRTA